MSFKYRIPTLGVIASVMSACAPFTPYDPNPRTSGGDPAPVATPPPSEVVTSPEQEEIRRARKEAAREAERRNTEADPPKPSGNNGGNTGGSDYRRAIPIPGKEGFVFNPFTNNPVDVRGIPSGTLVRDPQDTNTEHKFRVP